MLPITAQLLPIRWRNVIYLAEVAALTRLATGVARVLQNQPSRQKDPTLAPNEKRQAMIERFFVEIVGTIGYMGFLHVGQDLVDKIYNKCAKPKIPAFSEWEQTHPAKFANLSKALGEFGLTVQKFDQKIKELYEGEKGKTSGLLYRVLYDHESTDGKNKVVEKATLARLQEKIAESAPHLSQENVTKQFNEVLKHAEGLKEFALKNNKWAAAAIITGVGISALIGGMVTQWMNDRLVAPQTKQFLRKKFPEGSRIIHHIKKTKVLNSMGTLFTPHVQNRMFVQNGLPQSAPMNPFNAQAGFNPTMPTLQPYNNAPVFPVYAPNQMGNPKTQPHAAMFGGKPLPRPYTTPLASSYYQTRLGGRGL